MNVLKQIQKGETTRKLTRAGASAMARSTAGRSRVMPDKTKYDRRRDKRVTHE